MNETLRMIRIFYQFKQREMAERLGISRSHLSELELGRKGFSLDLLKRYADVIGVPLSSLVYLDEWLHTPNYPTELSPKIVAMMNLSKLSKSVS